LGCGEHSDGPLIIFRCNKRTLIKLIDAKECGKETYAVNTILFYFILVYCLHFVMSSLNYENWVAVVKTLTAAPSAFRYGHY
jgi:hypothetical protein